jgi:hypothetical protein
MEGAGADPTAASVLAIPYAELQALLAERLRTAKLSMDTTGLQPRPPAPNDRGGPST